MKEFSISKETAVVTSTYITHDGMPILYVSHDDDEEGGDFWQFHCGNGDYSMERMQLVRLSTIIRLDPNIVDVSDLPVGFSATRREHAWVYQKETE